MKIKSFTSVTAKSLVIKAEAATLMVASAF